MKNKAKSTRVVPIADSIYLLMMMMDVFTWRHVYDVKKRGETRRLLDDVSRFIALGKLTALMGESGAGKVRESRKYVEELS